MVTFIHDQIGIIWQHPVASDHIRQQQCMVDDDQMRRLGCHARAVEGTGAAGSAHAYFGFAALVLRG